MVDSKFKVFGIIAFIILALMSIIICFCIYTLVSVVFLGGHIIPRGTLPPIGALAFIFFLLIMLFGILYSSIKFFFIISIDTDEKTILFKNIITQKAKLYSFSDLDGYLDTYAVTKNGDFKVIYFVKNKKAEKIINGYYYSNMDEMQSALVSLNYLGFQKNFKTYSRKAFFNQSLLD